MYYVMILQAFLLKRRKRRNFCFKKRIKMIVSAMGDPVRISVIFSERNCVRLLGKSKLELGVKYNAWKKGYVFFIYFVISVA